MNVAHRRASPMARAGTVALVGAPAAAQDIKECSVKFPIVNNIDLDRVITPIVRPGLRRLPLGVLRSDHPAEAPLSRDNALGRLELTAGES